jgi:DNA-binding MarR family transcriptional regulator
METVASCAADRNGRVCPISRCSALLRTADLVRRVVGRVLEPYDITAQQYNVLRILRGSGEQGLPTLEIAERMIEHAPGVTRLMDRLEVKGLVRRERCPGDRRQVLCWLTAAGAELVERLDEPIDSADAEAVAMLGPEEQERLLRLLDAVRSGH